MKIRCIKKTDTVDDLILISFGKTYDVIDVEKGWYRIIDNSGEDYLYPPEIFKVIES